MRNGRLNPLLQVALYLPSTGSVPNPAPCNLVATPCIIDMSSCNPHSGLRRGFEGGTHLHPSPVLGIQTRDSDRGLTPGSLEHPPPAPINSCMRQAVGPISDVWKLYVIDVSSCYPHSGLRREFRPPYRKVDVRLHGKGNSNSHGARPVHSIITKIWWIRTSRYSTKNSLSRPPFGVATGW